MNHLLVLAGYVSLYLPQPDGGLLHVQHVHLEEVRRFCPARQFLSVDPLLLCACTLAVRVSAHAQLHQNNVEICLLLCIYGI